MKLVIFETSLLKEPTVKSQYRVIGQLVSTFIRTVQGTNFSSLHSYHSGTKSRNVICSCVYVWFMSTAVRRILTKVVRFPLITVEGFHFWSVLMP